MVKKVRANAIRVVAGFTTAAATAILLSVGGPATIRGPAAESARLVTGGRPGPGVAIPLGVALLVLARGLAARRRLARHLLLVLVPVALVAPLLTRPGLAAVAHRPLRWVVGVAVVGVLLRLGREFPVPPDPRRVRTALCFAVGGLVVAALHGGWLAAVDRDGPVESARLALGTGGMFGLVATGSAVAALAVLLAPAPAPPPDGPEVRSRVAALVAHPDADSLAPFAIRTDKTYAFSPDGRAAIGYRVVWGTALAGGDPVGAAGAADGAIAAFLDTCARTGWRPAVLGASAGRVDRWRAQGLRRRVVIGDEAVLDVGSFALTSRRMRNLRQAVHRTHNAGVTVHIGQFDSGQAEQLEPVLREWLCGHPERGFAMNLDQLLRPRPDCLVAVGYDRRGVAQAFARFPVCAGGRVLTLDVAPRRAAAPNGIVERLIVDVLEYGRTRGVAEVSLNFAGLRRVYAGSGTAVRAVAALAHLLDAWIELGPLYRFTAKFQPRWRPRSVLMASWLHLVPVGAAALRAEFGRSGRLTAPAEGKPARQAAAA
jgi:lysyl-tRNA synthetase class 2